MSRIVGSVRDRLPRLSLDLNTFDGPQSVEFILDTGFAGDLTLPPSVLAQVDASPCGVQEHFLADGSVVRGLVYLLYLNWLGEERQVEVIATHNTPALGRGLLAGCRVKIFFIEGGEVTVERL